MRLPSSLFLTAALGGLLAACGGSEPAATGPPPPLVEAVQARFGALPRAETVAGVVRARNQVTIRPQISARVERVLVRGGETVRQGQELVRLEATEPQERLRQAEANVRLAEAAEAAARARVAEHEARVVRSRALAGEELISEQELEVLEAQLRALEAGAAEEAAGVEQARATAEERRSELAKTVVRSPVAGRIGDRRVEEGMLVDPSTPLFVAGDLDRLLVEVTLPESMLAAVAEGMTVLIEPRSGSAEPVRAALTRISPFLDERSFTSSAEIELDEGATGLRPGMFVNVRILVGESSEAVLVPLAAVWNDDSSDAQGVFLVTEASDLETPEGTTGEADETVRRIEFRPVDVVADGSGAAGVRGIEEGSWVVTIGQHLLDVESAEGSGARVRPVAWSRVTALQSLQDEDLLEGFLDKQRKVAAALGAEIPASEDEVDRVMQAAAGDDTPGGE